MVSPWGSRAAVPVGRISAAPSRCLTVRPRSNDPTDFRSPIDAGPALFAEALEYHAEGALGGKADLDATPNHDQEHAAGQLRRAAKPDLFTHDDAIASIKRPLRSEPRPACNVLVGSKPAASRPACRMSGSRRVANVGYWRFLTVPCYIVTLIRPSITSRIAVAEE